MEAVVQPHEWLVDQSATALLSRLLVALSARCESDSVDLTRLAAPSLRSSTFGKESGRGRLLGAATCGENVSQACAGMGVSMRADGERMAAWDRNARKEGDRGHR